MDADTLNAMLTQVEFLSAAFPPYPTESTDVNPGRFGKRLAEFLAQELQRAGASVGEPVAEDWGWMIPILGAPFTLWIGVGNRDEHADAFLCFIEPHTQHVRRLWRKVPTREHVERLRQRMDAVLRSHPDIRAIEWSVAD